MMKMFKIAATAFTATIAAGALVLAADRASAQGASETERNRALVAKGLQAWADGTGSPYDLLAEDAHWTITGNSLAAKTYPSKEAFLSEVIRPFNARMRDRLIPSVHRIYAEGDTVIAHFDASGTARDGKPYRNSYAWILRMQDGRIVEAHAFFDAHAFDDFLEARHAVSGRAATPDQRPAPLGAPVLILASANRAPPMRIVLTRRAASDD